MSDSKMKAGNTKTITRLCNWMISMTIVSMSSTKSPISSGPTNSETHNSSTAQRCWRRSLYFRMIQVWWVGEIEFQQHLAWFVISKGLELRGWLAANQSGVWKVILRICWQKRCATRKGGVPDVKCRVGKRSADGDGGVQNEIGGRKLMPWYASPMELPIYTEHHRKGGR